MKLPISRLPASKPSPEQLANPSSLIGRKARFFTSMSNGGVACYLARVVKLGDDNITVWVEIPEKVRALPFPPANGKRFARYHASTLNIIK